MYSIERAEQALKRILDSCDKFNDTTPVDLQTYYLSWMSLLVLACFARRHHITNDTVILVLVLVASRMYESLERSDKLAVDVSKYYTYGDYSVSVAKV